MFERRQVLTIVLIAAFAPAAGAQAARDRAGWVAMAKDGFALPGGTRAVEVLLEMNALLASPDPVLRDEVAYSAAERWILRDKAVDAAGLRQLLDRWSRNLDAGLGESGSDTVFGRSFSALCLSLIAAADLQRPFLEPAEVQAFFDRMLDYFARERDLRGFDTSRGWMHTVAHTSDALKFLARNSKLAPGVDTRLLAAARTKIESTAEVFAWGENDRLAFALHAAVRRPDADSAAFEAWAAHWISAHTALWSGGPQVNPRQFAHVENAKQVLRSLHAALSMDAAPTPTGSAAQKAALTALAKLR